MEYFFYGRFDLNRLKYISSSKLDFVFRYAKFEEENKNIGKRIEERVSKIEKSETE